MPKSTIRTYVLMSLGLIIVIIAIVYVFLYVDLYFLMMRISPIRDNKLAMFYRNGRKEDLKEIRIKQELESRLAAASNKKIIIFWAPAFGQKSPVSSPNIKDCGNCDITYNRTMIDDDRTGAVLYHFDTIRPGDMPKSRRNPNHLHIFWTMEASATMKRAHYTLETEDKFGMNATMTYRLDSDFLTNYGGGKSMKGLMGNDPSIYQKILKRKTKLAITVVSDCAMTEGAMVRLALLKQLKEAGLRIDTFGKCFSNWIDGEVLENSANQYKFYFAYENSYHCRDYMTEKFFIYAITHDTVPVVWGAKKEDYEAVVPAGSFIYAEDFESPQHLIKHLNYLDQNDDEYLKFFRWRTMKPEIVPQYDRVHGFCAICRALHGINVDDRFNPKYNKTAPSIPLFTDGIAKRVVPSLRKYLYEDENPECFTAMLER